MSKVKTILLEPAVAICAACFLILVGIWVGYKVSPLESLPGMLILLGICISGIVLAKVIPISFPAVGWAAIVGVLVTVPGLLPWASQITAYVTKIPFLATATPALAFAGIAVGKDWKEFVKIGWKGIIVSLLVLMGTFMGSAIVAEILLRFSGA